MKKSEKECVISMLRSKDSFFNLTNDSKYREKIKMEIEDDIDYSYWVKDLDVEEGLLCEDFEYFKFFEKIGDFIIDNDIKTNTKLELNIVKGKEELYSIRQNLVYIILKDDKIVKIGGTKTGMKARITSYKCGHYIRERKDKYGKNYSGKPSATNAYVYNTLLHYIKKGEKFSVYIYPIEDKHVEVEIFGKKKRIKTQIYEEWEKECISNYKDKHGKLPILCNNSHP